MNKKSAKLMDSLQFACFFSLLICFFKHILCVLSGVAITSLGHKRELAYQSLGFIFILQLGGLCRLIKRY